jgi:Domain of unknown function (DUF4112)
MENNKTTEQVPETQTGHPEFQFIDSISSLLDNQFRIPYTNIRFGVDFLIGLIPTAGDWLSFGISSSLVFAMLRRGIGVGMLFKMLGNITLDAVVGSIPILGDLFDLHYKANRRNVNLLKQYYAENPNPPAAKKSFFVIGILFLVVLMLLLIAVWKVIGWLWAMGAMLLHV